MTLFSKRYRKALAERRLRVTLSRRLRKRIWYALEEFNASYWYRPDPDDNWHERTSLLGVLERDLLREYGQESLLAYPEDGEQRAPSDLRTFILGGWPSEVLDAVEHYATLVGDAEHPDAPHKFSTLVNRIMREEYAPWLLTDGAFVKVDNDFIALQLGETEQALHASGFPGALAELREARADLTAGDVKGAIVEACKAYESALKTLLGVQSGNASTLTRRLREDGLLDDLPADTRSAMTEQVLMTLPAMRNRLGGHGQGEAVLEVPRRYGDLAVALAASFLMLCVDLHDARSQQPQPGATGSHVEEPTHDFSSAEPPF